jgi:hypothetical protein
VVVSAIKAAADGEPLIQVGGNVEHGDSGGPALDAAGHIVGVVSFGGCLDTPCNTAFLRSSNDALPLLQEAGISTAPGRFERAWTQAFYDYAATYPGHWHQASSELDALAQVYPNFQGLQPYRDYADSAASTEQVPSSLVPTYSPLILALAGGAVLVVLVIVGVVVWLIRRRTLVAPATPTAPGMYPGYGLPGYPSTYPPTSYAAPGYPPPGSYPPPGPYASGYVSPATGGFGSAPGYTPSGAFSGGGHSIQLPAAAEPGLCANGHALAPGESICRICGAPRAGAPTAVSAGPTGPTS